MAEASQSGLPDFEPRDSDSDDGSPSDGASSLPAFGPQFPAFDPAQDACRQERKLEARYRRSRGWNTLAYGLAMAGASIFMGAWTPQRGVLEGNPAAALGVGLLAILVLWGLWLTFSGLQQLFDRTVQLRLDETGLHDRRTKESHPWTAVRAVELSRTRVRVVRTLFKDGIEFHEGNALPGLDDLRYGGGATTVVDLWATVEAPGGERSFSIDVEELDCLPDAVARIARRYITADPQVALARLRKAIVDGTTRGASLDEAAASLLRQGAPPALVARLVTDAAGGEAAHCARCKLTFDASRTQCPHCWEKLVRIPLQTGG